MQGYIDGATDMLPYVKAAFAGISPNVLALVRAYQINSEDFGGEIEATQTERITQQTLYRWRKRSGADFRRTWFKSIYGRGNAIYHKRHALYKRAMAEYQSYQTPTVSEPLRVKFS